MAGKTYSITYNPVTHATVINDSGKPGKRFIEVEIYQDHSSHRRYFEATHPPLQSKESSRAQDVRDSADGLAKQLVKGGVVDPTKPFKITVE